MGLICPETTNFPPIFSVDKSIGAKQLPPNRTHINLRLSLINEIGIFFDGLILRI